MTITEYDHNSDYRLHEYDWLQNNYHACPITLMNNKSSNVPFSPLPTDIAQKCMTSQGYQFDISHIAFTYLNS